ncbi:MAG: hypothetical protein M1608_14175 [Candidatus Omnitrophica bacterium]|nr:hypothetical protein [Candidatus Omnitrophota bacterium]
MSTKENQLSFSGDSVKMYFISLTFCTVLLILASISLGYNSKADTISLVKNASFEEATDNPWRPTAWNLGIEGLARGTFSRVDEGFHGPSAIRITNQSQAKSGVYTFMFQDIAVKRHTDYVISMYVRCKSVKSAWYGGGPAWAMREPFPQDTGGKWARVSAPCNSGDSDTWKLLIVLQDITESFDIDAVQMEEGKVATEFRGVPCTMTLENKAYAGIYESPKEVNVSLKVTNYQRHNLSVTSSWQLRQLPDGRVLSHNKLSLRARSNGSAQMTLPFDKGAGYGLYEYLVHTSAEGCGIESEARVAIMRPPPMDREMDLGFTIHAAGEDNARLLRRLGLRWARVGWNWSAFSTSRDQVSWEPLDKQMEIAEKYGLKLFPILTYVPSWAKLEDGTFDPQDHADYVGRVLRRYKGKLPAFNVWNEPEGPPATSALDHPKLWEADLKAVRQAARSADPNCKIVGLAMGANPGDTGGLFDLYLKPPISLGQYLDAYDWHNYPYPRNRRPELTSSVSSVDKLRESVPKIRDLVAGKEVWITEHGFSICSEKVTGGNVTEKQQGDYLVRQVILEFAYGIDKVFLYQLGPDGPGEGFEEQLGITRFRSNGLSAKLAYVQIANMIHELAGAVPVEVEAFSPNIRVARFRRGSTDVVAAWTVQREIAKLNFRVEDGYQSDPFGNRITKQGSITVELTESPIFLAGKKIE